LLVALVVVLEKVVLLAGVEAVQVAIVPLPALQVVVQAPNQKYLLFLELHTQLRLVVVALVEIL